MKGPSIGHVTPEALDGGPIALLENGDMIEINVPKRTLSVVGLNGETTSGVVVEHALEERRSKWIPPPPRHNTGILSLYSRVARGASDGASIT